MKTAIVKVSFLLMMICSSLQLLAQSTSAQSDLLEKLIENMADEQDENTDYSSLLDDINQIMLHPININTANKEELKQLFFLNQNQIQALISYRESKGDILSLFEIQLIPGFSMELAKAMAPLICLQTKTAAPAKSSRNQQMLLLRSEKNLEKENGYKSGSSNNGYQGNDFKYYARYQFQSLKSGINFGWTAEKDKGEAFFGHGNRSGFDFYSMHFQKKLTGVLRQINLGDYEVKFGQGLILWSGISTGKSSFTTQNSKRGQGIRAYRSTDENHFFRGAAAEFQMLRKMKLACFASSKNLDGSIHTDSLQTYTSSLVNTGLHRTKSEREQKNAVREKLFGTYIKWNDTNFESGIAFLRYSYSPEIVINPQAYSQFNFSGKDNYNISFSYQGNWNKFFFFGEAAYCKSGGKAILQGANIEVHPQLNVELIYRNYDQDYQAHYANAFSEQSKIQNEQGIYIGLDFHPLPKWSLKAYYDQFEFPWLRYTSNAPSEGHEYFAQLAFTPNEKLNAYVRFKQENKAENRESDRIATPLDVVKSQWRFHVSAQASTHWEIRNRIELSQYRHESEQESGFLIYQDLIYRLHSIPLNVSMRYTLFDTESYASRIYAYESNILYAYSIPAYYGKGSRFYLNLSYKINRKTSIYARYARTQYSDRNSIGSGNSELNGNHKSEVKFQLRYLF